MHLETCRSGFNSCIALAMKVRENTPYEGGTVPSVVERWEGLGMCHSTAEGSCEDLRSKIEGDFRDARVKGMEDIGTVEVSDWTCEVCSTSGCNSRSVIEIDPGKDDVSASRRKQQETTTALLAAAAACVLAGVF